MVPPEPHKEDTPYRLSASVSSIFPPTDDDGDVNKTKKTIPFGKFFMIIPNESRKRKKRIDDALLIRSELRILGSSRKCLNLKLGTHFPCFHL
jgi:hypothetical protein